jgi:hypothetical protein
MGRRSTLWGDLAWQLGRRGLRSGADADASGTSPGKAVLETLLSATRPCVILIDELVAYVRQFEEGKALTGGSFDSNLSFVQALTEALKAVPTAVLLASLPESDKEAGSQRGVKALARCRTTLAAFRRCGSRWGRGGVRDRAPPPVQRASTTNWRRNRCAVPLPTIYTATVTTFRTRRRRAATLTADARLPDSPGGVRPAVRGLVVAG